MRLHSSPAPSGSVPLVEQRRRVLGTFSDKNCFSNGSETVSDMMTAGKYERLAPEEKELFAMCKMWRDV